MVVSMFPQGTLLDVTPGRGLIRAWADSRCIHACKRCGVWLRRSKDSVGGWAAVHVPRGECYTPSRSEYMPAVDRL